MKQKLIAQGAEASIFVDGKGKILKERVVKGYRLKILDEKIRKLRTRSETKLLEKSGKIIAVPKIMNVSENSITLEKISGKKLSEHLDEMKNWKEVCGEIGKNVALLHDAGIIHGDLTTSNMLFVRNSKKLYFIDFGLGFHSTKDEDKAVDLHVLKEALEARHYLHWERCWGAVLKGYSVCRNSKKVLKRLENVEKRGRYKNSY